MKYTFLHAAQKDQRRYTRMTFGLATRILLNHFRTIGCSMVLALAVGCTTMYETRESLALDHREASFFTDSQATFEVAFNCAQWTYEPPDPSTPRYHMSGTTEEFFGVNACRSNGIAPFIKIVGRYKDSYVGQLGEKLFLFADNGTIDRRRGADAVVRNECRSIVGGPPWDELANALINPEGHAGTCFQAFFYFTAVQMATPSEGLFRYTVFDPSQLVYLTFDAPFNSNQLYSPVLKVIGWKTYNARFGTNTIPAFRVLRTAP